MLNVRFPQAGAGGFDAVPGQARPDARLAPGRLPWLDVAKGAAMVLVVVGHNELLAAASPLLNQAIFAFHVPLFFMLSGMTLPGCTLRALALRCLALLWVYVPLALLPLPKLLLSGQAPSAWDLLAGMAYGTGLTILAVPLWFLPCLALALPLAAAGLWLAGRARAPQRRGAAWLAAAALLLAGAWLTGRQAGTLQHDLAWGSTRSSGWPWSADLALLGAGFAIAGALLRPWIDRLPALTARWLLPVLVVVFTGLFFGTSPQVDLNLRELDPAPAALLASLVGAVAVAMAARLLPAQGRCAGLLAGLGRASLPILALHNPIQHALGQPWAGGTGAVPWVAGAFAAAMALLLPWWLDRQLFSATWIGRLVFYPRAWWRRDRRHAASRQPARP